MKRLISFALLALCLFGLESCAPKDDPKYANTVAHVGWANDLIIYDGALNAENLLIEGEEHLPVFKLDTSDDLEQFKSKYGSVFAMDLSKDDVLSFEGALKKAQWDREGFFKDSTLLIVYVPTTSGSYRYGVKSIETTESSLCVYVEQKNDPKVVTEDMDGYFVLIEVDDSEISRYGSIDAILASEGETE